MIERLSLATSDGETLEARWDRPDDPQGVVVFCHAHPMKGGTMMSPLMVGVTTRLVERGFAVLRFNFRGTGESTGTHDDGGAEIHDVEAAAETARATGLPLFLAGWSFGAGMALNWLANQQEAPPFSGIAPWWATVPESELPAGPKRIVLGTRDQVVDHDVIRSYAEKHSIDVVLTPGDHFFHGRGKKIGNLVAQGFEAA
jgi:alpha/beta superfamily hydrolase